jgi:hypothetical protein
MRRFWFASGYDIPRRQNRSGTARGRLLADAAPRPLYPWKNSLLLASETGSGLGVDLKSLACTGFRISDHSARRESL